MSSPYDVTVVSSLAPHSPQMCSKLNFYMHRQCYFDLI